MSDLPNIALVALQSLFAGSCAVALAVGVWEHRRARSVQRNLARLAILRTDTAADRHGLIDDLAHAVRHFETSVQAQWVCLGCGIVAWWLW